MSEFWSSKPMHLALTPGSTVDGWLVFVEVRWKDGRLSITGVQGPKANGGCHGSCGQIVDDRCGIVELTDRWTWEMVDDLCAIWKRWHLNDMRAGTPAQEACLRDTKASDVGDRWVWANETLATAGLNPDPSNGYRYGSAWLHEGIPEEVMIRLLGFPPTTWKLPAKWAQLVQS